MIPKIAIIAALASPIFAAAPLADFYDGELKRAEREVTRLAEAMPAEKYTFAPTIGEFKGVRTFGGQVKHVATLIYQLASDEQKEKPPVDIGTNDDGPDSVRTKAQILAYLKGAFAYAHKSVAGLTNENQMDPIKSPSRGGRTVPRVSFMSMYSWHSFDHYGQMVVYARMSGVVPGAQPAASAAAGR